MYLLYREKKELDRRKKGAKVAVSVKGGGVKAKMRRHPKQLDLYAVSFNDETD
jgi:hypothetical protein